MGQWWRMMPGGLQANPSAVDLPEVGQVQRPSAMFGAFVPGGHERGVGIEACATRWTTGGLPQCRYSRRLDGDARPSGCSWRPSTIGMRGGNDGRGVIQQR